VLNNLIKSNNLYEIFIFLWPNNDFGEKTKHKKHKKHKEHKEYKEQYEVTEHNINKYRIIKH